MLTHEELRNQFFQFMMNFNVGDRTKSKVEFSHQLKTNPFAMYFHFPFCQKACKCCVFGKTVNLEHVDQYCEALIEEIQMWSHNGMNAGKRPNTIFFGGGSPSLMPLKYLEKIMETTNKHFPPTEDVQVTIEVNPGTVDAATLDVYRKAGINRINIGGQSLHDACLQEMGRLHNAKQVIETIELVKEKGFPFNVDLLIGFESQTTAMLIEDVQKLIDFDTPHISVQIMTPNTETFTQRDPKMQEKQQEMYYESRKLLLNAGYDRFTTEEYSKSSPNLYHKNIWSIPPADILAFGAYTFGAIDGARYGNLAIQPYIEAVQKKQFPHAYSYNLSPEEDIMGKVLFGLRNYRVPRKKFLETYKVDPAQLALVSLLKGLDLVTINDEYVQLTEEHFEFCEIWNLVWFSELFMILNAGSTLAS